MRKLICLLLIIIFTVIFTTLAFAEGKNVNAKMYVPESFDIKNQNVPQSGELVQTGGIPAGLFYGAGGLCIVGALVISRKKSTDSANH